MGEFTDELIDYDRIDYERELDWQNGIHITRDGTEMMIKDMTTSHLKNTIRFFRSLDTSPLEKELKNRK